MLCCASTASEFFKLNGHTEDELVISRLKLLSFTLNKWGLVTWLISQSKQSRAYTPLQKMRGIFLFKFPKQPRFYWETWSIFVASYTTCFFWHKNSLLQWTAGDTHTLIIPNVSAASPARDPTHHLQWIFLGRRNIAWQIQKHQDETKMF